MWTVGILLFDDVEVLDFAGPFEVFSTTVTETGDKAFEVSTISQYGGQIKALNGLKVQTDYNFENAPNFDILLIPGGYGAREVEIKNTTLLQWISEQSPELLTSVCTGALLLAAIGKLDGLQATTHWNSLDRMEREYPQISVLRGKRFVDQGDILTSAGISAGIDMSLYIVERLLGEEIALKTAKRMEYRWERE